MNPRRTIVAFAIVALASGAFAAGARAQAVRSRMLEELSVERDPLHWVIVVRFSVPIRVLRYSPHERSSVIHVDMQPVLVPPADGSPGTRRESLAPAPALRGVLREVVYDPDSPGSPRLDVFFERDVEFELTPGEDFRSVVIRLPRERAQVYAVQIGSIQPGEQPPAIPELAILRGRTVYGARFVEGENVRRRIRVGFYAHPADAEAAAAALRAHFPGAIVVGVSDDEQRASQALALGREAPPAPPPAPGAEGTPPPTPDLGTQASDWMEEGRRALTAGELQKAVLIFTRLAEATDPGVAAEAKELLGLSRERSGQLAHAKAEYEEYLARFPDAEGAERVRQRLDALLTAGAPAREPLDEQGAIAPPPSGAVPTRFRSFGSAYVAYSRQSQLTDLAGEQVNDSWLLSQLFLDGRLDRGPLRVRGQFSGDYQYELEGSNGNDLRVDNLFVEASEDVLGLKGSLGRRTQSTGGVLGRYDGGWLAKRIADRYQVAGVAGLPVYGQNRDEIDTDRVFAGLAADVFRVLDVLDLQVFGVQQWVGSRTDRTAVGGELRYFDDGGRYAFGFVDYDVHFLSLNVAQLNVNAPLGASVQIHALADYRNLPVLTTSNALIGQPVDKLDDLDLSDSELEDLARDRTAEATTLNLGGSWVVRRNLQLAADVTAAYISDMPESADVPAIPSTGWQWTYLGQLIANDVLQEGDTGVLSLRYFDGNDQDAIALTVDSRHPITRHLRFEPLLTTEYRFLRDSDMLRLRPAMRIDYRRWGFELDLEAGFEWSRYQGQPDESGYYLLTGLRYDF